MAVMDEFEKEREEIKGAPLQAKMKYIWDYNKGKIIIGICLILILAGFISVQLNRKEQVASGVFLNCYEQDYVLGEFSEEFLLENDFNVRKQETYFVTDLTYVPEASATTINMDTNQALMVYASSGVMDFFVADSATMNELAEKYFFADLKNVLQKEDYEALEPYFVYYENEAGEQIPVLLEIGKSDRMEKAYGEEIKSLQLGILLDVVHPENMKMLIDYLMK